MLEQFIRLLSEPPGTLVYQFVTLFAIQVTLALAYWQWRRSRRAGEQDGLAWRLLLASGGLLLGRLLLAGLSLYLASQPDNLVALRLLPPAEQALNTATLILLAWALLPPLHRLPRLTGALAMLLLLLTAVLLTFFLQSWPVQAAAGTNYNATFQATIWSVGQLALVVGSVVWVLAAGVAGRELRLIVLLTLLAAHVAHLWNYPEVLPSSSEIPYWVRLGHLIALPLLAVIAYRHVVQRLLAGTEQMERPDQEQQVGLVRAMADLFTSLDSEHLAADLFRLVARVLNGRMLALVLLDLEDQDSLMTLVQAGPADGAEEPVLREQVVSLSRWAALRLALEQQQRVELRADGMGAYQMRELTAELALPMPELLIVEPLLADSYPLGMLLVGLRQGDPAARALIPTCAALVVRVLGRARAYEQALHSVAPLNAESEAQMTGRIIAAEEERDRVLASLETLRARLERSEHQAATEKERAADLAAALATLEENHPAVERVAELEGEVRALRETLYEAEEAMAHVAAGEGGLSTEWVMLAISRYSAELEKAQVRLAELEAQLARRGPGRQHEITASLAQELRTPLTSIEGYTDLLLAELPGTGDSRQRNFLLRVKANAGRMHSLLEQLVRLTTPGSGDRPDTALAKIDVREEIESAISMVSTEMRQKALLLRLNVAEDILPLSLQHNDLCEIVVHLLHNVSQRSARQATMTLNAHADAVTLENGEETEPEVKHFLHVAVSGGKGERPEQEANPSDLTVTRSLVQAHGGRLWVDSRPGQGSTFSVLLPATPDEPATGSIAA